VSRENYTLSRIIFTVGHPTSLHLTKVFENNRN
jgi:hypothetical protein